MLFLSPSFGFGPNFNFDSRNVFLNTHVDEGLPFGPTPTPGNFLLLDSTPMLLLDGTTFLLL